jgi:hypothetical protein
MPRIITFFTQAGAIRYEKQLRALGDTPKLKPVPRQLSSSCGICIETSYEGVLDMMSDEMDKIFRIASHEYILEWENDE